MPIEKGIIDVQLANTPRAIYRKAENNTNNDWVDHGTKNVVKINFWLLMKSFSNKTGLVSFNGAIGFAFDSKHPFVAHKILPWCWWNEIPSFIPN